MGDPLADRRPLDERAAPPAVIFGPPRLTGRSHGVEVPFYVAGEKRGHVAGSARSTSWSVHSLHTAFRDLNARHHRTLYSACRAVEVAAEIDRGTAARPTDWPPGRDGSLADFRAAPAYDSPTAAPLVAAARAASAAPPLPEARRRPLDQLAERARGIQDRSLKDNGRYSRSR